MADVAELRRNCLHRKVTWPGCWVHARRRSLDAGKVLPEGKRGRAHEARWP